MKHQYAGDVGDLSKFALLQSLAETSRVGILWYLTPDESSGRFATDGRFTAFDHLARFDPKLVSRLKAVSSGARSIARLREEGLLNGIDEFDTLVPSQSARKEWFETARQRLSQCDAVLLDPDNGIASEKLKRNQSRAAKFAFREEMAALHDDGKTVICYQHASRQGRFEAQLSKRIEKFPGSFALRWHRLQSRAYIVWPARDPPRWKKWGDSIVTSWGGNFSALGL